MSFYTGLLGGFNKAAERERTLAREREDLLFERQQKQLAGIINDPTQRNTGLREAALQAYFGSATGQPRKKGFLDSLLGGAPQEASPEFARVLSMIDSLQGVDTGDTPQPLPAGTSAAMAPPPGAPGAIGTTPQTSGGALARTPPPSGAVAQAAGQAGGGGQPGEGGAAASAPPDAPAIPTLRTTPLIINPPPRPHAPPPPTTTQSKIWMSKPEMIRDETIARETAVVEGRIAGRIAAGMDRETALELERRQMAGSQPGMRFGGTLKGDQVAPGELDAYGRPVDPEQYYRTQIQPDGSFLYLPTVAPSGPSVGVDYNRAATSMGYPTPAAVPPERREELEQRAKALAGEFRFTTAQAGALGSALGGQEGRQTEAIPPEVAARNNLPAGTTWGELNEIVLWDQDDKDRWISVKMLEPKVDRIDALIRDVFVDATGFTGGVLNWFSLQRDERTRSPKFSALQGELKTAAGAVSTVLQGEVGRRTEGDISRALEALTDLDKGIFTIDTQESALARLNVARQAIEDAKKLVKEPPADQLRRQQEGSTAPTPADPLGIR